MEKNHRTPTEKERLWDIEEEYFVRQIRVRHRAKSHIPQKDLFRSRSLKLQQNSGFASSLKPKLEKDTQDLAQKSEASSFLQPVSTSPEKILAPTQKEPSSQEQEKAPKTLSSSDHAQQKKHSPNFMPVWIANTVPQSNCLNRSSDSMHFHAQYRSNQAYFHYQNQKGFQDYTAKASVERFQHKITKQRFIANLPVKAQIETQLSSNKFNPIFEYSHLRA